MKFFIIDETNIKKDEKFEFFVYGGLVVDDSEIRVLSKKLQNIKRGFNIKESRPIKWSNINWNQEGILDPDILAQIKGCILDMVKKSKCKILIYLSPHDFYHRWSIGKLEIRATIDPQKYLRAQTYAINVCLNKFNKYLEKQSDFGLVIADAFDQQHQLNLTSHCLSLYPNGMDTKLDQIIYPIIQVKNEHSHIHQINDVVLGAITCSMREMSENFLPIIKDNFLSTSGSDFPSILNKGINIYPKNAKTPDIKEQINRLEEKFSRLLMV